MTFVNEIHLMGYVTAIGNVHYYDSRKPNGDPVRKAIITFALWGRDKRPRKGETHWCYTCIVFDHNAETFHADVRATLEAVAARRQEAARSTTHGHSFEDAVWSFVDRRSQEAGDVPARTGSTPGRIPRCKVGDAVIELGPEHAAAGARIVIEAKERRGVDLGKAREEMATARKNRDAGVGIFVFPLPTIALCAILAVVWLFRRR